MKALARDAEERYQDAAEMYRDLERVLPRAAAAHRRRTWPASWRCCSTRPSAARSAGDGPAAARTIRAAPVEVHVEFDARRGRRRPPPARRSRRSRRPAPKAPARDPMSIQKLLEAVRHQVSRRPARRGTRRNAPWRCRRSKSSSGRRRWR